MFAITSGTGFHITFQNGITLSTQFGGGSYCSKYDMEIGNMSIDTMIALHKWESEDVEIAIWDVKGIWKTKQAYQELYVEDIGGDVKGYVKLKEWLELLDWCRSYEQKQVEMRGVSVKCQ